jgi:hypothetical protein
VAGIVAGGETHAIDMEEAAPVGQEIVVEAPAGGVALGRGGSEGGCEEMAVVALIDQVQDRVFIEQQVGRAGFDAFAEARLELRGQWFQAVHDASDDGARLFRIADVLAPDRFSGHEGVAQHGTLELDPFGQEGVGIGEAGDGGEECALLRGEEGHRYIYCMGANRGCGIAHELVLQHQGRTTDQSHARRYSAVGRR